MSVSWEEITEWDGDAPVPRSGHTFNTVGDRHFLFAGAGRKDGKAQALNDIIHLDLSDSEKPAWVDFPLSGEKPPPRSKHSATTISNSEVLVFGGLNQRTRYNDVWIMDVEEKCWKQVEPEGEAPMPRAHHTATLIGNKVYVFGGYGGNGQALQDLIALDLGEPGERKMSWEEIETQGVPPTPRFDHQAAYFPTGMNGVAPFRFIVLGGRDNSQMYNECHMLDMDTLTWQEAGSAPDFEHDVSNSLLDAVESVPYYKLFAFGGKKGMMDYLNTLEAIDVGKMTWLSPGCESNPPPAREDTAWVYDKRRCQLLMYGGWANRWLGDLHFADVSAIVGPPYAVLGLTPLIGPVMGGTEITITGLRFRAGNIVVRFSAGKSEATAEGEFVDQGTIKVKTPNFEIFGAQRVDVHVNISNQGWTVNKMNFDYFANTHAKNCLAFGPSLLADVIYGIEMSFIIQAKDTLNDKRQSGGDKFVCEIVNIDPTGKFSVKGESRVVDHGDGLYMVYYTVPYPTKYEVHIKYEEPAMAEGEEPSYVSIRGSPFVVTALDPWTKHRILGATPNKRKGVMMMSMDSELLVWGGDDSPIQMCDASGADWKWAPAPMVGDAVAVPRRDHSATVMGNEIVLFGGQSCLDGSLLSDMWFLKKEEDGWSWSSPSEYPSYPRRIKPVAEEAAEEDADEAGEEAAKEEGAEEEKAEGETPEGEEAAPEEPAAEEEGEKPADEAAAAEEGDAPTAEEEPATAADEEGAAPAAAEEPATPADLPFGEAEEPTKRILHCAVAIHKDLIVFGGDNDGELVDDYAIFNTEGRSVAEGMEPRVLGDVPKVRRGAAAAAVGKRIIMFSGESTNEEEEPILMDDMYVIHLEEGKVLRFEKVETTGNYCPGPRKGAIMQEYAPGQLFLYGGMNADNKPANDAFVLNTADMVWTRVFLGHADLTQPTGPIASLCQGKLMSIMSSAGSPKLDMGESLDFNNLRESYEFNSKMKSTSLELLEYVAGWTQTQSAGFELASNPEELAAEFDKLLKVMAALYEVKTHKVYTDLLLEQLREALSYLATQRMDTKKQLKQLDEVKTLWEDIKKQLPGVKASVGPVQTSEGDRIKDEVSTYEATVTGYQKEFLKKPFFQYECGYDAAYPMLNDVAKELIAMEKEVKKHEELANMFDFPDHMLPLKEKMQTLKSELVMVKDVWDTSSLCEVQFQDWRTTLWADIRTDLMEEGAKAFVKEVKGLPKRIREEDAYRGLDASVKNFLTSVPLVADLRSPAMRDRHWEQLMDTTGVRFTIDDNFKLDDLLALELHKFEEEVGEIVDRAQKEEKMEQSLAKLEESWGKIEFQFHQFKDTDVYTVKMGEEDFEALEDNQVLVQGMMANRYMATFKEPILGWNKKLMNVADVVQIMSEIQRTWSYLESLFIHSDEVKKELPEAADRFQGIDQKVKEVLKDMKATMNCVDACNKEGLMKLLESQQKQLEICEKALADYMESKRRAFPRFYFTSTADLLDILSNGNSPTKVMIHMSKVFQAIDKLELDTEDPPPGTRPKALGMISCVGIETVKFQTPLPLTGKVEEYMNDIIGKMRGELRELLHASVKDYPTKPRDQWLFDWSSQLILVVNQIFWCQEVEEAFSKMSSDPKAMATYNEFQVKQLTKLIEVTRGNLPKPARQKVMNMITIDAHSRDMVDGIVQVGATEADCFQWSCQLRSYWDTEVQDCRIRICDASFPYGYEYLGNGPRLVITPLTDRIYITATQACWLSLGTAPAGPAGTGKTETTKDLSAQLGKSVYVFNCAPEMDYRTMGDIFKGLAASGSWGCFDEFNRLVPEVLSVCSVQYKCVTDSQRRKTMLPGRGLEYVDSDGVKHDAIARWTFIAADGVEMPLEEGTSAFITMNPGYIGRAELPESLKALFRPITVMVPDRQLIMENMLMAEGFVEAKMLAKKFASLYYLLEDLLSPQKHYDWGLRAIKSVLVVAGTLLRAEEGQVEADVLFRALRDFNIPKILSQDMVIFMGLLNDLFPGTDPPRNRDMVFEDVIVETTLEMGLEPEDDFILRVVQLSELLAIRHCVFLMGPTGTARTEAYRVLAKAIMKGCDNPSNSYVQMTNRMKVTIRDINPKSISTQELYGYVNMATREWKDGLLSYNMRELANQPDENPKWILLDGDLDANWIESMNSVMDDNRLLTLPSNERIRLLPHMKLIFEIRDLKFATPATATRAGILYISEAQQWNNMIQSWIKKVVPAYATKAKWKDPTQPVAWMKDLFSKYVPDTLFEMRKSYVAITPLNTMNYVTSLVNILEGLLKPENLNNKATQELFELYFVFAMVWAFGSGMCEKDGIHYKRNFDKWFKQTWTTIKFPGKGTVYDYFVNPKTGKFQPWAELVADVEYNSDTPMSTVFVPTPETSSLRFFLDLMVNLKKPIMFVGGAGVGKTQLVKGKLAELGEEQMSLAISFNYFTDVISFQRILESPLEKKAGINFGPPGTKSLVYFVDDLNMPKLDPYETAMPISLIRQHLGWGHWFDRAKLIQKNINNTQYVACMNPTAGSFVINPRLQRLFMTIAMEFPGQDSLMKIYGTFINGHLKKFSDNVQELGTKILQAALALHDKVASTFRKTAINFHYEFTVRHLANVFQGLLMSTPDQFNDPVKFSRLWLHESERVYADRLVTPSDLEAYNKIAQATGKKFFSIPDIDDYYKKNDPKPLIYCHFAQGLGDKIYDEVEDFDGLYKTLMEALEEYNETNAVMDLVLFEDAMKHICRISRIISNPSGHALLVGVGGSGKQSLSRLAAHICGYATYMIIISGSYNMNSFREDLQKMYRRTGQKGEGLMFLFTDSQITDEKFLVFINDLLSSGEIPDLFPAEDKDEIINAMRGETKALGLLDTTENCWNVFIQKVKANLHMVFTVSPVGENFRTRSQRFLATVTSTVIDWFQPWPESSLFSVAKKFLDEVELGEETVRSAVNEFMPFSFAGVNKACTKFLQVERRYNYTTPKTFLELIKLYKNLLSAKRTETQQNIDRLETGLEKLHKTQKDVDILIEEAKVMSEQVEVKVKEADAFAEKVGIEKEKANEENDAAQIEAEKCAVIATDVSAKQASCEKDLAAAEPLVQQAEAALDTLNKKDLGEAKSLKKPPAGVDDITAVVLILLDSNPKDKSWAAAQKMMGQVDKFLERLKSFKAVIDEGKVTKKTVEATRSYLALPHFNKEAIFTKSRAAAGLCEWAINIVLYYDVVAEVEPKRQELAEANAMLDEANTKLAAVQARVAELNAMVADLEQQFAAATKEKEDAIAESERCERKLNLANRLISALASEGERWAITVDKLKVDYEVLTGDMLLAAAFVSYAGPFTSTFRAEMIEGWLKFMNDKGLPMTDGLVDPLAVLVDNATVASWVREGLPSDPTSVQNGTILQNSERWPLMMDPQLQGIVWIKERESKNNLVVLRMGSMTMVTQMERAMEAGHSVLIENMAETIDAVINPVVTRSTFKKGRAYFVKLGDKEVEFHKDFKLFMHTKLSNPHYGPEIQAETTLINFTVTELGLEDQLLALVVNKERPDLEETKTQLIIQNTEFTIKLKELEDGLLYKLSTAEGDLTEDVALIESLEESKEVADEISLKVAEAKETQVVIDENRNKYRPVARRGAMLFFLLNSLNKIHAFYQFSLNAFVVVFSRGIDLAPGGKKKKPVAKVAEVAAAVEEVPAAPAASAAPAEGEEGEEGKEPGEGEEGKEGEEGGDTPPPPEPEPSAAPTTGGEEEEEEEEEEEDPEVVAAELEKRLLSLIESCTFTVYDYTRRGLFDRDKLIFSSLLTFQLQLRSDEIDEAEYDALCKGIKNPNAPPITDDLSRWMSEAQWSALNPLTSLPVFASLPKDMEKNSDDWQNWNSIEQVERAKMPGEWGKMSLFRQLLIIRAMRPDRVSNALEIYVEKSMGERYTNQEAFNVAAMMEESSPQAPIFFVLFPGYSPSKEFEVYANQHDHTVENGMLTLISMGQGQEAPAESVLDKYTEEGGWVFLDNVHLMQGWIPRLERKLEIAAETAHEDFRCLFSAEPINGAPFARIVPESILQTCIKISNEPPSDMKSNMRRALAGFSQETMDRPTTEEKRKVFSSIMFGLCFYHSLLLGRKKFGTGIGTGSGSGLGFCRGYSFNMGDLTTCGDVLYNYLEGNEAVPWADLRYMFGEVFYGGHITDSMDRRCCNTYLDVMIVPDILPNGEEPPTLMLAPGLKAPMPGDYEHLKDYINNSLPAESPVVYGMHPNAELSLLTQQGEILFKTVIEVSGGGGGGAGAGAGGNVRSTLESYLEQLPEELNMVEIESRVKDKTPYVVAALQESGRMNGLLSEMRRSMEELTLGLDGALNMSDKMEALAKGLATNSVPALWMGMMSTRIQEVFTLTAWYHDVIKRYKQLAAWTAGDIVTPTVVWLPGLFNPKAFLTAVMQVYARANSLPLDVMKFMTEVTTKMNVEQVAEPAPLGVYIHGLCMEGARWDREEGCVMESRPGELHPVMPVIQVVPVTAENYTLDGYYNCPVYTNMQRANVYSPGVSNFTLKTKEPEHKWTLASVALLLQDELA